MSVTQSDPLLQRSGGMVGRPISRVDGERKVRGAAPFAAEFALDGMVYAALVFSTVAKGRITTLDTAEAESAKGVVLVMTHRNTPPLRPAPLFLTAPAAVGSDELSPLQDDTVHWNGQPIALVLAQTQEQADHAASLVRAQYATEPATTEFDRATQHSRWAPAVLGELDVTIGDAEAALAEAPARVDRTYRTPRHNHNAIEPHAVTVAWEGDTLRVHDSTQGVTGAAWTLAQVFDLPGNMLAGGSTHTASVGAAVAAAYHSLVEDLVKLIGPDSPLAGVTADELEGRDGGLVDTDDPSRYESYESILGGAGRDQVSVEADASEPEEVQRWSMHSYGAQFCEVRVNASPGSPGSAGSSAPTTAGASSTRRPPPASSGAGSSWGWAWP